MKILTQRIYDKKQQAGYRILVDRLWPRGITKREATLDGWCKEIAPSTELRKWFHHEEGKWPEFCRKYLEELKLNRKTAEKLLTEAVRSKAPLVLLYGAKSKEHNHALVLKAYLATLMENGEALHCASPPCFSREFDEGSS